MTPYACTSKDRVKVSRATFLTISELVHQVTNSTKRNAIRENQQEEPKTREREQSPDSKIFLAGEQRVKKMATEAQPEPNSRILLSKTIWVIVVLDR